MLWLGVFSWLILEVTTSLLGEKWVRKNISTLHVLRMTYDAQNLCFKRVEIHKACAHLQKIISVPVENLENKLRAH